MEVIAPGDTFICLVFFFLGRRKGASKTINHHNDETQFEEIYCRHKIKHFFSFFFFEALNIEYIYTGCFVVKVLKFLNMRTVFANHFHIRALTRKLSFHKISSDFERVNTAYNIFKVILEYDLFKQKPINLIFFFNLSHSLYLYTARG